ncbi:hypothetical protein CKO28_01060 [Rhodovibrio sodomensis]|uniref:Uncharacterized protein n=1 Tax=Rhodovibrio sodomensis TaxID=1088 RepID=A0ABS1D927_9PROT|nr:hypothetical protein [Rhodovibrio sodomensis]MBK1666632.1 hypothetical protein [Rhodovibrio sodomensis]
MLRWLQRTQAQGRYRNTAALIWLAMCLPLIVTMTISDPQVAPLAAVTYLAPVLLPRVPVDPLRRIAVIYALLWAMSMSLAFGPLLA